MITVINHASDVYEFQKQLGRGSFGKVYQAFHKPTGELLAVKVSSIIVSQSTAFFDFIEMLRSLICTLPHDLTMKKPVDHNRVHKTNSTRI